MPGVILPPKFLFDDMTHQRTGPDPSFQPVSHRTAIQNVAQPLAIFPAEVRRPPAAVPFQQAFFAVPIPLIDPQRNGAAMHLEMVGDLTRGVPIQAHQDPLDAQHHPRLFIPLGLFSEFQQLGDGCLFALRKVWAHIAIITHFTNNVDLFMRVYIVRLVLGSPSGPPESVQSCASPAPVIADRFLLTSPKFAHRVDYPSYDSHLSASRCVRLPRSPHGPVRREGGLPMANACRFPTRFGYAASSRRSSSSLPGWWRPSPQRSPRPLR